MNYKTNKPASFACRAQKMVSRAVCSSVLVGMGIMMATQSSIAGSEYGQSRDVSFSPFSRVATMSAVQKDDGTFDEAATAAKAKAAGQALGFYLATVNEADDPDNFLGGNWILGGYDETPENPEDVAHAILGIPTPVPYPQKVNVLDLCNKSYASMALGVAPITGSVADGTAKYVVNGYAHTPTLPCEVAIYYDDQNVYVDMLDPSAIFKLFFSDVIFSDEMKDDEFALAIQAMPVQVKSELKSIIYSALTEFDPDLVQMDERMGPAYESLGDIIRTVQQSPQQSPYKHVAYTKEGGGTFSADDSKLVAQTIINTMSIHGDPLVVDGDGNPIYPTPGFHEDELEAELTDGSLWRSARPTALGLPGQKVDGIVSKNLVIEACSPFFAKQALSTGAHHATALPCEITVQIIDNDSNPGAETLVVSYLDAHFMFSALFSDMSKAEMEAFAAVPTDVMDDLEAIVEYSLANDLVDSEGEPIVLNPSTQIKYNMLPGKNVGQF